MKSQGEVRQQETTSPPLARWTPESHLQTCLRWSHHLFRDECHRKLPKLITRCPRDITQFQTARSSQSMPVRVCLPPVICRDAPAALPAQHFLDEHFHVYLRTHRSLGTAAEEHPKERDHYHSPVHTRHYKLTA
jgi:hypothetical protein